MSCHASCLLFGLPMTCIYSKPSWACSTNKNNHTCLSIWYEPMPSLRIDDINRPFWTFCISILYTHNTSLPASRFQCIFHQLTGLVTLSPELLNSGLKTVREHDQCTTTVNCSRPHTLLYACFFVLWWRVSWGDACHCHICPLKVKKIQSTAS